MDDTDFKQVFVAKYDIAIKNQIEAMRRAVIAQFDQEPSVEQVRSALNQNYPGGGQDAIVQTYGAAGSRQVMVRVPDVGAEQGGSLAANAQATERLESVQKHVMLQVEEAREARKQAEARLQKSEQQAEQRQQQLEQVLHQTQTEAQIIHQRLSHLQQEAEDKQR